MRFAKKIISFTLCTALLSGGSLAVLANVANADSNNGICSRSVNNELWRETLKFKIKGRSSSNRGFAEVDMIATSPDNGENNISLRLEYRNNVPSLYDYVFDDNFVLGVKYRDGRSAEIQLGNNGAGAPFGNKNIAKNLQEFIKRFNNLNIGKGDYIYLHGVKSDDSLIFSGGKIIEYSSKYDYSNGYKSRHINKWQNGFEIIGRGLYECPLLHK